MVVYKAFIIKHAKTQEANKAWTLILLESISIINGTVK